MGTNHWDIRYLCGTDLCRRIGLGEIRPDIGPDAGRQCTLDRFLIPRWTLLSHFFRKALDILALALGVVDPACIAHLVQRAGLSPRGAARQGCAITAINLSTIAERTDDLLFAVAQTEVDARKLAGAVVIHGQAPLQAGLDFIRKLCDLLH